MARTLYETLIMSLINIHTHHRSTNEEYLELISIFHNAPLPENRFFSIGIHPWHAEKNNINSMLEEMFPKARFAFAIGECGLDKSSSSSWEKQILLFREQINLSEQLQKPLIIHAVGSYPDIIAFHKINNPKQAWIIHGFQGDTQIMKHITDHGIFLSYGASLLRGINKNIDSFKETPIDKIFLETDESASSIKDIYLEASKIKGISVDVLENQITENFKSLTK
jgi:TatD DNase family protein